jgi:DNA polymerase-3 subunit beta
MLHIRTDKDAGVVRITGTDLDTAIRADGHADIKDNGEAVVDAKLLMGILDKLHGDDVCFETSDKLIVSISSDTAIFQLTVMPASDYPKIDIPIPGETVAISGLKRLIESTVFAAEAGSPGGGARPYMRCMKLTLDECGIRAVTSDGLRVAETAGDPEAIGDFSALIPAQTLKTFASISGDKDVHQFGVSTAGKHAVFFDGTVLFSTRIVESNYFDTDALFNSFKSVISAGVEADKLKDAVYNVSALSGKGDVLEMSFLDGEILLRCATEYGAGATSFPASVTYTDAAAQLGDVYYYSPKLLAECVKTLGGAVTMDVDNNGLLMIRHGSTRYIQLPAKRKTKAQKPAGQITDRITDRTDDHADITADQSAGAA